MRKIIYKLETKNFYDNKEHLPINISEISEEFSVEIRGDLSSSKILDDLQLLDFSSVKTSNITVNLHSKQDYIDSPEELDFLQKINSVCESKNFVFNITLNDEKISDEYHNFITAKKEIEELANKINSLKITDEYGENRPLSPLEKYVIVHKFVANRNYNKDNDNWFENDKQRSWIGLLTSDYAICSGFASLLKCVCDKVFNEKELKCITQGCCIFDKEGAPIAGHANNLVIINDPLYNLNGIYLSDSCWDSLGPKGQRDEIRFNYLLNPIQNYGFHNSRNFQFENCFAFQNLPNIACLYNLFSNNLDDLLTHLTQQGSLYDLKTFKETLDPQQELMKKDPQLAKAIVKDPNSIDAMLAMQEFDYLGDELYEKYKLDFIKQNDEFVHAKPISDTTLFGGFKALAIFEGLKSEKEIEEYAKKLLEETKKCHAETFATNKSNTDDLGFSLNEN